MAEMGLKGKASIRRRRTTDSRHDFPRYPNLVERLKVTQPDQVWVADITYVRLREKFVYLAGVMDVFTRRVRGWELGRSLDQGLTLAALRRGRRPVVHHSDQGVQYAAVAYTELLAGRGVAISMASVGNPEENGYAKRLMRTIREEEIDLSEYLDFTDAYSQFGRLLDDVYNRKRIHSSPGYLTPVEFEQQWPRGAESHGPAMSGERLPSADRVRLLGGPPSASNQALPPPRPRTDFMVPLVRGLRHRVLTSGGGSSRTRSAAGAMMSQV
jgi:putative transposase